MTGKELGQTQVVPEVDTGSTTCAGISLREYFAGQALPTIISKAETLPSVTNKDRRAPNYKLIAEIAVECADALLEELAKEEQ